VIGCSPRLLDARPAPLDDVAGRRAHRLLSAGRRLITGQALRSALFDGAMRNRDLANLHRFLTFCWVPFVALHVLAMTLDAVARVSPIDLVVPFRVSYAAVPIGLGTVGLDLLLVVTVTSYLRRRLDPSLWRWLHRLAYPMFGVVALHALLAGTDFARPLVLAPAAGVIAFIAIVSVARLALGRMGTSAR
jgi:sulfoxide reductase heme-binding subunit YedZ